MDTYSDSVTHRPTRLVTEDRRRRYEQLSRLLDDWANEPGDFDAQVAPLIEDALKETAPRHSRKHS